MRLARSTLPAGILALVAPAVAQLPYNPSRIVIPRGGSTAYLFSPGESSDTYTVSAFNVTQGVNATSSAAPLSSSPDFLSSPDNKAFVVVPDDDGITVLTGDCQSDTAALDLWRFAPDPENIEQGTWTKLPLSVGSNSLSANYLSAGFSFSPTASIQDASLYVFGGMCPDSGSSDASTWTSDATYSNTMLTLSPNTPSSDDTPYQLSVAGARAPPIAEAGLTITPLAPTFSNTSEANVSQQQNFVLLGGHTQTAFINMSQLALFSLPQESWAFVGVSQSSSTLVEPRSGHTALLTEDGSRVIVLGGWVGDLSTPAQPQLVILEVAQGYGGAADWQWTIPPQNNAPFSSSQGIYGHGVTMLPGGVMMVAGGHPISASASKTKRQASSTFYFFNTTSLEWSNSYVHTTTEPSSSPTASESPESSSSSSPSSNGLSNSERVGLGAGLGVGIVVAIAVAAVWLWYSRKVRSRRSIREKELRELALGAERQQSPTPSDQQRRFSGLRTPSWNGTQEQQIENSGDSYPWESTADAWDDNYAMRSEKYEPLLEPPSPAKGARVGPRGALGYSQFLPPPAGTLGGVFPIVEEDESSQTGSLRKKTPNLAADRSSVKSDPFKDPPNLQRPARQDQAALMRRKEVAGWVEDWQNAAQDMTVSRTASQTHSRTYSNLSQTQAQYSSKSDSSGRNSPEKSDRTGSNLSEKSVMTNSTFHRSGTVTRNLSQRSASAGYALFSGAAAAMSRLGAGKPLTEVEHSPGGLSRAPSNRSVSLNIDPSRPGTSSETFSTARSWAVGGGEDQTLFNRNSSRRQPSEERDYSTLPSPSKEKYARAGNSLASGRKPLGLLGSMRRVLTGTGGVDVQNAVASYEDKSDPPSPIKRPEMVETGHRRSFSSNNASFWQGKKGARDWEDGVQSPSGDTSSSSPVRRGPNSSSPDNDDDEGEWDIETAVQQRVVQVMFTVPKEKLRVVNADALSLLSSNRSEADPDESRDRIDVKRMSSVTEKDERSSGEEEDVGKGKGKQPDWGN